MKRKITAYLWIQIIQRRYGCLDIPSVDGMLDLLPRLDGGVFLLRLQIRFFRKIRSRFRISLHVQVVQNESIDIAIVQSAQRPSGSLTVSV